MQFFDPDYIPGQEPMAEEQRDLGYQLRQVPNSKKTIIVMVDFDNDEEETILQEYPDIQTGQAVMQAFVESFHHPKH